MQYSESQPHVPARKKNHKPPTIPAVCRPALWVSTRVRTWDQWCAGTDLDWLQRAESTHLFLIPPSLIHIGNLKSATMRVLTPGKLA